LLTKRKRVKKAYIKTFGCQMNVHDSEKMAGLLLREGYAITGDRDEADIIIFNTCSIRQKAEQKFLSELGRVKAMKKSRPGLRVAVAGCIAQQMGEALLKRAPHVDYLLGPQNVHAIGDVARRDFFTALEDNPDIADMKLPVMRKDRARAWVSIMFGCNNYCSYCVVPFTRGRERSRPAAKITEEVRHLADEGCKEITLLGQNVNSYTSETDFPGLLRMLDAVQGIERIRFVTSHPRDLSVDLISAMKELDKVCEHIHLPLQSGSTKILKAMNRGYSIEEYAESVGKLRRNIPEIAVTTDIIAGFPGETEVDHQATMRALEEIRFDGIFAFRFSVRPGTAAEHMDNHLPEEVKLHRLREILGFQEGITLEVNRRLEGTVMEILVEGESETDGEMLTGRTRTNKIVNFMGHCGLAGQTINVRVARARMHSLEGEVTEHIHEIN